LETFSTGIAGVYLTCVCTPTYR